MVYTVVSPFLSKRTTDKIKMLDTKEDLKKFFDEDCLLEEHGGKSDFKYDPYK